MRKFSFLLTTLPAEVESIRETIKEPFTIDALRKLVPSITEREVTEHWDDGLTVNTPQLVYNDVPVAGWVYHYIATKSGKVYTSDTKGGLPKISRRQIASVGRVI